MSAGRAVVSTLINIDLGRYLLFLSLSLSRVVAPTHFRRLNYLVGLFFISDERQSGLGQNVGHALAPLYASFDTAETKKREWNVL